ncbi:MAG: FKBP-type peptidyl-prolyl cis-trans isomerase [Balneolaceae bacterium]
MISKNSARNFLLLICTIAFVSACNNDSNPFVADYSDAPPLPDTTSALSKITFESGLIYYLIEDGNPESFDLVIRDDAYMYYTTRLDGEIIGSSYVNGSTSPVRVNNVGTQSTINYVGDGFVEGVLGMKEGERRVLVIPEDLNSTTETLVFDVEIETIDY